MAINLEAVAFRKSQVEGKISQWGNIETSFGSRKSQLRDNKQNIVKSLQTREQELLSVISPNLTIETLRSNIKQFHNSGLSLLSNEDARYIVAEYKRAKESSGQMALSDFETWFNEEFLNIFEQEADPNKPIGKNLEKVILHLVNKSLPDTDIEGKKEQASTTRIQSHRRLQKLSDLIPIQVLNTLAPVTQKRIFKYVDAYLKKKKEENGEKNELAPKDALVRVSEDGVEAIVPVVKSQGIQYIDWFALTKGRRGSEVDDETAIKTNQQLVATVHSYIMQKAPKELKSETVLKIVNHVFTYAPDSKVSKAGFIGKNEKNITGLFGEIQALCYLALLMGDNFELNNQNVAWAARETDLGKQYHADIVLKEAYGIQVKNTTKDIVDKIDFNSAKLDFLIDSLIDNNFITNEEGAIIQDIYATYYFNVPYIFTEDSLVASTNLDYAPIDDQLLTYAKLADQFLTLMFEYFMYIGTGNAAKNERGNLLFILGGEYVVLASEIYEAILEQIDKMTDFQISRPSRYDSTIENIVSFSNNNKLLRSKGDEYFISGIAQRVGALTHQAVTKSIILSSSFDFTALLK